ncbi:hypothetical protein P0E95_003411, partial [Vibrio metschnikovii]|nr:hypothetical protein [Vibrio metschnikovii]
MNRFSKLTWLEAIKHGVATAAVPMFFLGLLFAGMEAIPHDETKQIGCVMVGSTLSFGLLVAYSFVTMLLFGLALATKSYNNLITRWVRRTIVVYCDLAFYLTHSTVGTLVALLLWYPVTKDYFPFDGVPLVFGILASSLIWWKLAKICLDINEETGAFIRLIDGERSPYVVTALGLFLIFSAFYVLYSMKSSLMITVQ